MALKSIYDGYLGFIKQAAINSPAAPTNFVRFLGTVNMDAEQDVDIYPEGGGGFYNATATKTFHKAAGSFECNVRPSVAARLVHAFLGKDTIAGAGAPYTHTIIPIRPLPYLCFERGLKTNLLTERVQDAKIGKLSIVGKAGQPLQLKADWVGTKGVLQAANAVDTYETDRCFAFMDGTFTIFGGGFTRIEGFTLNLDNKLEDKLQTTEVYTSDVQEGLLSGTLEIDFLYDSADTNYAAIYYGAGTAIVETVATGAVTMVFNFGTGAGEREFGFAIPAGGCVYKNLTMPAPGATPGTLKQKLSVDLLKVAASELITFTSKNADAADYDI